LNAALPFSRSLSALARARPRAAGAAAPPPPESFRGGSQTTASPRRDPAWHADGRAARAPRAAGAGASRRCGASHATTL